MPRQEPIRVDVTTGTYRCGKCDAELPGGAQVTAEWKGDRLAGVHADTDAGNAESKSVAHACGSLA